MPGLNLDIYIHVFKLHGVLEKKCLSFTQPTDINMDMLFRIGQKYKELAIQCKDKNILNHIEHFILLSFGFTYSSQKDNELDEETIYLLSELKKIYRCEDNKKEYSSSSFVSWLVIQLVNVYQNLAQIFFDLKKIEYCFNFSIQSALLYLSQAGLNDECLSLLKKAYSVSPEATKSCAECAINLKDKYMVSIFGKLALLFSHTESNDSILTYKYISDIFFQKSLGKNIREIEIYQVPKKIVKMASAILGNDNIYNNIHNKKQGNIYDSSKQNNEIEDFIDTQRQMDGRFPSSLRLVKAMGTSMLKKDGMQNNYRLTGELVINIKTSDKLLINTYYSNGNTDMLTLDSHGMSSIKIS